MAVYDAGGNVLTDVISTYNGKKLSILGDSISTFIGWIPGGQEAYYKGGTYGVPTVEHTWWHKLMTALGMEIEVNNSWSGTRVTTTVSETSAGVARADQLGEAPDVIIVYMGINDFNNEVALGTYDGTGTFPVDTTTFREAYAIMLNTILTTYKTAEVWCATLPYEERNPPTGSFPEKNGNGVTLKQWNDAIRDLAALFGLRVLEHAKCGLTYQNYSLYVGDYDQSTEYGLHPNSAGHSLIANNDIRQMDEAVRIRYQ